MPINEPRSIHAAEDWGVVLQSVPAKNKREIIKRLEEIFELDKRYAEQILSSMPLILLDNLSFGLAARIKKFFQTVGAVAETTNHDMIKKNCFQVVWPQTPDLAFFMKNETGPNEASVQDKTPHAKPEEIPPVEKKAASYEKKPEMPKIHEAVVPPKPAPEFSARVPQLPPVSEEKPATVSSPTVDSDWERRAKELNEKLQKIHEEKQELHVQHAEATEKVKSDFQQRLEEEKKKSGEVAKAYEDLQKEAQKQETLTREVEEWRSRAVALGEKVGELEASLRQKTSAVEHLVSEKEDLARKSEKTAEETQRELSTLRSHEQEFFRKIEALERNVQEMTESLRSRDSALAQFEKQIMGLAEKAKKYDTIRQEYDAKFAEQEVNFAKAEEEHRRYRSRVDRKTAAATRELGEWVRDVDAVRQGLQKLILFLGSESAVLDAEKKSRLKSPLTRGPSSPSTGKI